MIHDWHNTAMGDVAFDVLELNGGMRDVELVAEAVLRFAEDGFAFRRRNVFDGDVASKSGGLAANAPDMQIVHVLDAVDVENRLGDKVIVHSTGSAFKENVERLAHDSE